MSNPDHTPAMKQSDRHDAITELVLNAGTMRIDDIAEYFSVSTMTVHRDLDALAAKGVLRKSRGSVTAVATSLVEANIAFRERQSRAAKEAVARAALDLVEPGQAVILDDSTTGLPFAQSLPRRAPLTVVTNSARVLATLANETGISLISTGGQYYSWCDAFMGAVTLSALRGIRADIFFMSAPAIVDGICFHQHHDTVLVKQAMFDAARSRILYVDHTKFGQRALHAMAPLTDFDAVIVDSGADDSIIARLHQSGVHTVIAQV